jgi:hypothetical protein
MYSKKINRGLLSVKSAIRVDGIRIRARVRMGRRAGFRAGCRDEGRARVGRWFGVRVRWRLAGILSERI